MSTPSFTLESLYERKLTIVDRFDELESSLERFLHCDQVGVDAEMDFGRAYLPSLCLLQLSSAKEDLIIDILSFDQPQKLHCLAELFENPEITKIFHAGLNDVPFVKKFCGSSLVSVVDTQMAANVLALEGSGLKFLVSDQLGVEMVKGSQNSDWTKRPLKASQLNYARVDSAVLLALWSKLSSQLDEAQKLRMKRKIEVLEQKKWGWSGPKGGDYLKVKGGRTLRGDSRQYLKRLYEWRDSKARRVNRSPRQWLSDSLLLRIAKKSLREKKLLKETFHHKMVHRYADEIIELIGTQRGRSLSPQHALGLTRKINRKCKQLAQEKGLSRGGLLSHGEISFVVSQSPRSLEELTWTRMLSPWQLAHFAPVFERYLIAAPV